MLSGCSFFTLSERWISEIHVGLGGTAGVLFVRQLAEKRHRGLPGRIEASESGGGFLAITLSAHRSWTARLR